MKTELIETLNTVTSGKIFVEVEKARSPALARIKEDAGPEEAADIMQEVAVETYGALSKHEKVFFIEEQVRCARTRRIAARRSCRAINPRCSTRSRGGEEGGGEAARRAGGRAEGPHAAAPQTEEEKAKEEKEKKANVEHAEGYYEATTRRSRPAGAQGAYYELMIRYHAHANDYLEMCRCYRALMKCDLVANDAVEDAGDEESRLFVVLAPIEPMQRDLMARSARRRTRGPAPAQAAHAAVHDEGDHPLDTSRPAAEMAAETEIFGGEDGERRSKGPRQRVIEHNLLVIGAYYSRVTLKRPSELLCLNAEETEKHLADLVTAKKVAAKIDRPGARWISNRRQGRGLALNEWVGKVDKLLATLDKSVHLIHKEAMANKVSLSAAE